MKRMTPVQDELTSEVVEWERSRLRRFTPHSPQTLSHDARLLRFSASLDLQNGNLRIDPALHRLSSGRRIRGPARTPRLADSSNRHSETQRKGGHCLAVTRP